MLILVNIACSQYTSRKIKGTKENKIILLDKKTSEVKDPVIKYYFTEIFLNELFTPNLPEIHYAKSVNSVNSSFDILSTIQSNLSFGGFWDKYVVINFTPQVQIKPTGFLNIYSNHYLNCLIPLDEVAEYSRSIVIQAFAFSAFDNSVKLITGEENNWILNAAVYTVKNILLNILVKPAFERNGESPSSVLMFDSYYYSININF